MKDTYRLLFAAVGAFAIAAQAEAQTPTSPPITFPTADEYRLARQTQAENAAAQALGEIKRLEARVKELEAKLAEQTKK